LNFVIKYYPLLRLLLLDEELLEDLTLLEEDDLVLLVDLTEPDDLVLLEGRVTLVLGLDLVEEEFLMVLVGLVERVFLIVLFKDVLVDLTLVFLVGLAALDNLRVE